jgi:hypothetical protein
LHHGSAEHVPHPVRRGGSDVDRDLTGILFTQRAMTSPQPPEVFVDFWDCAYGALDDR